MRRRSFLLFFSFPTNITRLINIPLSKQNSLAFKIFRSLPPGIYNFYNATLESWNLRKNSLRRDNNSSLSLSLFTIAVKIFRLPPLPSLRRISDKSVLRMYTCRRLRCQSFRVEYCSSSQRGLNLACVYIRGGEGGSESKEDGQM